MLRVINVVLKGSPLDFPFAPNKKRLGAAGLLAGAGLIGTIINSQNQSDSNSINQRMNKENNDTQIMLAREANAMSQQQFDRNMNWLREQYYDTKQMKRAVDAYRAAGLNPALAYGSPNAVGSVGAPSQSQFHVAQTEAGHVEPIQIGDALSESVGHATDAYFNNQLINEQTENVHQEALSKRIQNFTQFARDVADLRSKYADIELKMSQKGVSDAERDKLKLEKDDLDNRINLFWRQFEDLANQPKKANRLLDSQADNLDSLTAINKIEAQFKPALLQAGIKVSQSQASQLQAMTGNLWEEAKTKYHYRHDIMPLEEIEKKLANGISAVVFNGSKGYEDFLKDNDFADWRNFMRVFGEFLFKLQPR